MGSPFTIKLEGLNEVLAKLKNASSEVVAEVDAELQAGAKDVERDAAKAVPVDVGFLKNAISSKRVDDLSYEVVAQESYAPYVEFGTRSKVKIPEGLEAYAAKFRGKSDKKGAWLAISAWCKRKGIEKSKWYSIYKKIMTEGVNPQPFMFPALQKNLPKIVGRIEKVLKKKR